MIKPKESTGAEPGTPGGVLSVALRPRTLSGLYGQEAAVKAIRAHMAKRQPRTWLFSGPPGTGKTTLARIMAVAYQCDHMKLWGDPCKECRAPGNSWAIHDINAAKHSGVEELERISELAVHRPISGHKRVIILDECHMLSKQAWSSVLTPLEEPPEFTVWILCTSDPGKVPAANLRRAVKYGLKLLTIDGTDAFLRKYALKAGVERPLAELIDAAHTAGIGSPGVLLQALEKYGAGASAVEAVAGAGTTVNTFALCKAVTAGAWPEVQSHLKDMGPEDVRWVRASVAGWLRGRLARETSPAAGERTATSILELCTLPFDESVLGYWLHATLYRITRRFAR